MYIILRAGRRSRPRDVPRGRRARARTGPPSPATRPCARDSRRQDARVSPDLGVVPALVRRQGVVLRDVADMSVMAPPNSSAIMSVNAPPNMRPRPLLEPTPTAKLSATSQQQTSGVPMNAAMNFGFTITTLMLFIVALIGNHRESLAARRWRDGDTMIFTDGAMACEGPC